MKKMIKNFSLLLLTLLSACAELPQPEKVPEQDMIPKDRLAFYVIMETSQDDLQGKIHVDSIKSFGKRFIAYDDIISYDTLYFTLKLTEEAIEEINQVNIEYANWCLPYAVVSNGEVIFGAYLYHPLSSCFPYWYYSTTVREGDFGIFSPVWTIEPVGPDPRKDPRIIRILASDGKIAIRERTR